MRVIELTGAFGLDHLALAERAEPLPGPGEVRVRLRAASLNYRDLMMVRGEYNPRQPLPLIPCSDGAGEIDAIGEGVTGWKQGDPVVVLFAQGWLAGGPERERVRRTLGGPLDGTLAEHIVVSSDGVARFPEGMTYGEAACLPCAGLTAWSALFELGSVKPGDTVLVQGSGGVSTFALLFARAAGARVIATTSSEEKAERLRAMGAFAVVNYRTTPRWGRAVRELTGGVGVDHVVEVGGAGTLGESLDAVRLGGTVSVIGVLASSRQQVDVTPILMKQVRVQGVLVGHRDGFLAMSRCLVEHRIKPVIDRVFPLEDTRLAFEHLASGGHVGKVGIAI
jgi:NADPH:quinone reductase-like Zn-dependent oxidoreductase